MSLSQRPEYMGSRAMVWGIPTVKGLVVEQAKPKPMGRTLIPIAIRESQPMAKQSPRASGRITAAWS